MTRLMRWDAIDSFDDWLDEDLFMRTAQSRRRFPLDQAPQQLRQMNWTRGVYVIFEGTNRRYVGASTNLPRRIGTHLWYAKRLTRRPQSFSVKVFHYPNANLQTLLAREREYLRRFPGVFAGQINTADDDLFF
jgi:predicted GIY-YIG superfamily endonuclease